MKNTLFLIVATILAVAPYAAGSDRQATETVSAIAAKAQRPPGSPRYSDVCFSSRWKRPKNNNDSHDTLRDAASFHATRLDWVYSFDPKWIRECKNRGYYFGAALNSILKDGPGQSTREKGRVYDKEGQLVSAPWMEGWDAWWGCVNSPEYREIYLAHAKLLVDGGADSIQQDDPGLNVAAAKWGGCYCEHCRKKAADQGVPLPEGMAAFQKASVAEFYALMRKEIDLYAGRHVPFSSNNFNGLTGFPFDLFEYGLAELPVRSGKPDLIYERYHEALRQRRPQIFTLVSKDVLLTRRAIAMAYACGGHLLPPYDVFHGKHPRIFGAPKDSADLYGFVRANAAYFDGYEDAAIAGEGLKEERYEKDIPMLVEAKGVYAFVRARPGEPDAAVVVHVVDWRDAPQPFVLKLKTARFFGAKSIAANLLTPSAYDKEIHIQAEKQGDFSPLSKKQELQIEVQGPDTIISVPSINPWGMVVLTAK